MFPSKRLAALFSRSALAVCTLAAFLLLPLLATADAASANTTGVSTIEVDPWQDPNATDPTPVWAIAEGNGRIYIGGQFTNVAGQQQAYLAAVNSSTGQLDTAFRPVVAGGATEVFAITLSPDGSDLYLGGVFRTVNGVERNRIAKVDAFSGALDMSFNPNASAAVETIAVDGQGVYVGGKFATIGGVTSPNLVKLNATTGQADPAWNGSTNGPVFDIELFNNNVYAVGNFTQVSGSVQRNVVRLERSSGAVHNQWNPSVQIPDRIDVVALSDDGQRLFVGTAGSLANGGNGNSVWALTTTGGARWQKALSGDVQALEALGDTLFIGSHGDYIFNRVKYRIDGSTNPNFPANGYVESPSNANAISRGKLMSVNLTTGTLLPWDPDLNSINGVWTLESGSSGLLVGGDFTAVANPTGVAGTIDTVTTPHVAIFSNPVAVAPTGPGDQEGDFACTVSTNGNDAVITYSGDRGDSVQLLGNGSWIGDVTNSSSSTVAGGAGDTYAVRARGSQFSDPFEDIPCTGGGSNGGGGDLACSVSFVGDNATVTLSGDRGDSVQLLRNGSWAASMSGTSATISASSSDSITARVRGDNYSNPYQDILCSGGGTGSGDFSCTVTTSGTNAVITYSGDLGDSLQLLRNGSWNRSISNTSTTWVSGGAGDDYAGRIRGDGYAAPFQDVPCN